MNKKKKTNIALYLVLCPQWKCVIMLAIIIMILITLKTENFNEQIKKRLCRKFK